MTSKDVVYIFSDDVVVPIIDNCLKESKIIKQFTHTEIISLYDVIIAYSLERLFRDTIGINLKYKYIGDDDMLVNVPDKIDNLFNRTVFGNFIYSEIELLILDEIYSMRSRLPSFSDDYVYCIESKLTPSSITCIIKHIKEQ